MDNQQEQVLDSSREQKHHNGPSISVSALSIPPVAMYAYSKFVSNVIFLRTLGPGFGHKQNPGGVAGASLVGCDPLWMTEHEISE